MSLLKQIPKEFYNLFRTTNREYYFEILIDLYQANMEEYYHIINGTPLYNFF